MENNSNNKTDNPAVKKPLYKKPSFYIGILVIVAVIIGGLKWYTGRLGFVSTDDAFIDANRMELGAKMLGRVTNLLFDEGDTLKAGQLVAKIQLEKKVIPQAEFDNIQNKLSASQAELKLAHGRIIGSETDIKAIQIQLTNTKIYSPMNGVIAKKWILVGDVIQPGQPIYSIYDMKNLWVTAELEETKINSLSLGDSVSIDVDAYPEHIFKGEIYQIGTNTAAQFALIPSGNFTKVTQRIPVKISIKNDSDKPLKFGLMPGMSVEVKIKVADNG